MISAHRWEPISDTKFMQDIVSSARAANALPIAFGALVIAAPIGEELAFRGFLYRTLELKFGGITAIVVTAFGWAALHIQYSLIGMAVIFASGLFFGAIRRYSGSLYLTMLMHALWNGAALAGAMLMMPKA
ncbi:MAG: CPBP family intramembrane glutamic endopeptidase [Alphaproteobacteria bacterium]